MSGVIQVSGLRLTGELAPMGRSARGLADLVMEAGDVAYPDGKELLDGGDANGQAVTILQDGNVVFVRFHGLGDAALDLYAGTATIEVSESWPAGMDKVLAAGPVLAVALSLTGPAAPPLQRRERRLAVGVVRAAVYSARPTSPDYAYYRQRLDAHIARITVARKAGAPLLPHAPSGERRDRRGRRLNAPAVNRPASSNTR